MRARRGLIELIPAASEDAIAATRWVIANAAALGGSAGGNLAALAARLPPPDLLPAPGVWPLAGVKSSSA